MKRIGIFVFYDREGIVDTYVEFFLAALKIHLEALVIVCNGKLSDVSRKCLEKFTDNIFIRENTGYDAMAYKLAMTTYVGWEALEKYDELLLINDTFFGPFYPLDNMFFVMNKKKCDFWGITCHRKYVDYYSGSLEESPAYIQSYFMGIRKEMFQSKIFQGYWEEFNSTGWIFSDVLTKHEKKFTYVMEQAGFTWDTYVHAEEYDVEEPRDNFLQYYYIPYQLLKDYSCPILKKKSLVKKHLTENPGELGNAAAKSLLWIKENTEYDIDMIWENLLRLYDMRDLWKALNLNYVISDNAISDNMNMNFNSFIYIDQPLTEQQKSYIELLKSQIDSMRMVLSCCNDNGKRIINSINCLSDAEKFSEYILLLISVEDNPNKKTALNQYSSTEEQWGNLIGSRANTQNIIKLFMENKRLGLLLSPCGIHGSDFGKAIYQKLQGCMALWCRKNIFLEMREILFSFIKGQHERTIADLRNDFINVAQRMGYYSAVGMKSSYISMAYSNMNEMLQQIEKHTKARYKFKDFGSYLDGDMFLFCKNHPEIYVYGAGDNGSRAAKLIVSQGYHFSGFIVSDNQPDLAKKQGFPVYRLSEIGDSIYHAGIVISVTNRKFQSEIMQQLQKKGIKNIYLLDT